MSDNNQVVQIPIEDLVPNRNQPRISFDQKALDDLANSIKQHGIIQPLVVRRLGDKYEIIAGERRYKAAQIAGLVSVPGIVANVNDQSSAEMALVENIQRKDLSAIEEAKSYKNILEIGDMTQEELAKKMGLSQSAVANKLRLLNLNEEVQNALLDNRISERHARSLLSLDDKTQAELLRRIIDERLTVRQLDEIIKSINNPIKDDEIDDVPLVDIDENLEEMQKQATDINPQVSKPSYSTSEDNNKFFKYESVDTSSSSSIEANNMQVSSPEVANANYIEQAAASEGDFFNFGNNVPNEEPSQNTMPANDQLVMDDMVEEVLDVDTPIQTNPIDNLNSQTGVAIFDGHSNTGDSKALLIANKIKERIKELNVDNNIRFAEADLGSTYNITINIEKDS